MNEPTPTRRKRTRKTSRRSPPAPTLPTAVSVDEAAWEKACDEVAASILSGQVRQHGDVCISPGVLGEQLRHRIPQAKLELGEHPAQDATCTCRHRALLTVGANNQAEMTGTHPGFVFDAAHAALEGYLARRN